MPWVDEQDVEVAVLGERLVGDSSGIPGWYGRPAVPVAADAALDWGIREMVAARPGRGPDLARVPGRGSLR